MYICLCEHPLSIISWTAGNRTVRINGLETTSLDGNVSFTVSHADYISVTSPAVTRYQGKFTDLKVGAGGAVGEDGLSSVTVRPSGRDVLIENLYTTTDDGNIRVIVTSPGRDRQFQNVRIEDASVGASVGQNATFKFTIPDEEYTEDMVVNVDMVNLVAASTGQPGEKDKLVVATKATNSYTYAPSRAGEHTLNLKTTENAAGECSVTISASGFSDASAEVEQKSDSSISVGGGYTISHGAINLSNKSYNAGNLTVNIDISNLEISAESIDENTEVTHKIKAIFRRRCQKATQNTQNQTSSRKTLTVFPRR